MFPALCGVHANNSLTRLQAGDVEQSGRVGEDAVLIRQVMVVRDGAEVGGADVELDVKGGLDADLDVVEIDEYGNLQSLI